MNQSFQPPEKPVAIVTGAARGIGAAIAQRLAEDGFDLALVDLDADTCTDTAALVKAAGQRAHCVSCNVSDEAQVADAVSEIENVLGAPTALVNNAGVLRDATLTNMSSEDWDLVIDVNLKACFLMCRQVAPYMRAAKWGRIVNLSSIAALGVFGESNYSAAKAGIQGISKTLAIELGPSGVTANVVAPGFVVTEMTKAVAERIKVSIEELSEMMKRDIVVDRTGTPQDIANAVSFFCDARSSFVTGQVLYVAGAPRG